MNENFVPLTPEETLLAVREAKNGDENAKIRLLNGLILLKQKNMEMLKVARDKYAAE